MTEPMDHTQSEIWISELCSMLGPDHMIVARAMGVHCLNAELREENKRHVQSLAEARDELAQAYRDLCSANVEIARLLISCDPKAVALVRQATTLAPREKPSAEIER